MNFSAVLLQIISSFFIPSSFAVTVNPLGDTIYKTHTNAAVPVMMAYFKAKGTYPEWSLNIGDDRIAFESGVTGFETFNAPQVEPVKVQDANVRQYSVHTEQGEMVIRIAHGDCQVADSREGFSYKVDVDIKRGIDSTFTTFSGCGVYITDPRLQGKWILAQIKDQPVTELDFPDTIPYLILKSNVNAFSGFAGCNTVSGRLFSERSLLRFTDLVLSKMTCPSSASENAFLNMLRYSTEFKMEQNQLFLAYPGHTTLVFRRGT